MKSRNSNIESLRLLCMVMIVSMHIFGLYNDHLGTAGLAALSFNNAVCNMGVSVFMLISGYYGIQYKPAKLLSLMNIALFWSVVLLIFDVDHTAKNVVKSVFPVFTAKYWFLTAYIVIAFLAPYIDKIVSLITQRQFLMLITILCIFFVLSPSFLMLEIMHDSGKGVINMLLVYLIGRYMAIYGIPRCLTGLSGGGILLLIIVIITGVDFTVTYLLKTPFQMLARDNSIFILLGAMTLFSMVMSMKPITVGLVNELASYVFPIYINHGVLLLRLAYIPEDMSSVLYLIK